VGGDRAGPFALGVLVEVAPPQPAASSAASSTRPVRLSAVNWIAEETELVSIERKRLPYRRLVMDQYGRRFLRVSTMGFLPLVVFLFGAIVWWRRRQDL